MSDMTRKFRFAIGLATLAGVALAAQSAPATDVGTSAVNLTQRLEQIEEQMLRIAAQVNGSNQYGTERNRRLAPRRSTDTVYSWERRMLEGH